MDTRAAPGHQRGAAVPPIRMRLPSRRNLLRMGLGAAALGAGYAYWHTRRQGGDVAAPIEIEAAPIRAFQPAEPERRRFGALTFRSGLVLTSKASGFGGLSGLWRDPQRSRIVAVSDHAQWLTADLAYEGDRLSGLREARLAPILGPDGVPLRQGPRYDCEALAIAGGEAFVGIERTHEVLRFAWEAQGVAARGQPIDLSPEVRRQPPNRGIEALCVAPPGHPLAGALLAFAEGAPSGDEDPTPGWVLTGPERFSFRIAGSNRFNVTDAVFLETGELILLERSFSPLQGVACRIRRIARDAVRPGAVLDGQTLLEADNTFEIDNMEGIARHRDPRTGETVLTLVSDDNFLPHQRTLLLEFALGG